jgi:putative nucleotidyltransferase with HDIG domain
MAEPLPATVMSHEAVERLMSTVRELPTLPSIATRLAAVARDPDSTSRDMAAVISQDQALTANLLRAVNSAYFGFLRRISSVLEAINLLGYNEVVNMAFTVAVIREFDYESTNDFDRRGFWTHSICVATASQMVAEQTGYPRIDAAFTAGLLHDLGKLILDQFFSESSVQIVERMRTTGISRHAAEIQLLGVSHADIGGWIAQNWLLPEPTIASIRHHHHRREQRHGLPGADDPIIDIVQFSDLYCRAEGYGNSGDPQVAEIPLDLLDDLRLSDNILPQLGERISAVVEDIQAFF